jgi:hypothetical protein
MENSDQQQTTENVQPNPQHHQTSYTSGLKPKKKSPVWILMIFALLLIGGGIYFLVKRGTSSQTASPTPENFSYTTTEEPEDTEEPTSSPKAIDRESIKIQILNGTGIPREASFLQGKLRTLGYTQIEVGNVDEADYEATEVNFSSSVPDEVVSEITKELEKIYEEVNTKTGSTGNYDIKIITGLQKGATAKPAATKSPSPTTSPTATTTSSPSPTATP